MLTLFATLALGYHPFAEDGGLYAAGVEKLLQPSLFPAYGAFVAEHLRFSLFAPLVAGLVRISHLPLAWVLAVIHVLSMAATLAAAWLLARRVGCSPTGCAGAAALLACWLGLPIAGTSLMLMDPYVTARSLSTPLVLAAVAFTFGSRREGRGKDRLACAACLLSAAAVHPLMAAYGFAAVALAGVARMQPGAARRWTFATLAAAALAVAAALQMRAAPESPAYLRVALTRYYWFPGEWHWYEQFGLPAPCIVIALLRRTRQDAAWRALAETLLALAAVAFAVALAFSHAGYATHLVARLQPLRSFQVVYEGMIVLLGAWLGERWLAAHPVRWATALMLLAAPMFFAQRVTYPAGVHLEWPGRDTRNQWVKAFDWARTNTPESAVFALDARYITRDGEDAQCFRAIARRSALPDYSKDGGEASITPALTAAWAAGMLAQQNLDTEDDATRRLHLAGSGADWVVLKAASPTAWRCPYSHGGVKICQLPVQEPQP